MVDFWWLIGELRQLILPQIQYVQFVLHGLTGWASAFREVGHQAPTAPAGGIAWERGRPARILLLWPPLSFRPMQQEAILSAEGTVLIHDT